MSTVFLEEKVWIMLPESVLLIIWNSPLKIIAFFRRQQKHIMQCVSEMNDQLKPQNDHPQWLDQSKITRKSQIQYPNQNS